MADQVTVDIFTTANRTPIGSITFQDSEYGLLIQPKVSSLNPGLHGFHIHQKPSCGQQGKAAEGHFDPAKVNQHLGPYQKGHFGDLPALYINASGRGILPMLAPKLKVSDILKHSVIIHDGGDNYSDKPLALGGGGARIACGVVTGK